MVCNIQTTLCERNLCSDTTPVDHRAVRIISLHLLCRARGLKHEPIEGNSPYTRVKRTAGSNNAIHHSEGSLASRDAPVAYRQIMGAIAVLEQSLPDKFRMVTGPDGRLNWDEVESPLIVGPMSSSTVRLEQRLT